MSVKDKIFIKKESYWVYNFLLQDLYHPLPVKIYRYHYLCDYCKKVSISDIYVGIINDLKKANLLEEDYKLICCYCKVLKDLKLFHLRGVVKNIHYEGKIDHLVIELYTKNLPIIIDNFSEVINNSNKENFI